jgi:Fe-S oxidoreductase
VVGLEPSCVAVFRDEMVNLFPHDEDAKRLSEQSFLLSEFLVKQGWQPPQSATSLQQRKAVVHGHCHHKAIMKMDDEETVLSKLGLDFEVLDSGCCGMAGAFGFEKNHYDVSIKVGERVLIPAVRDASKETLVIADGFSCREQIAQTTDRRALHLAQVIQMAMHERQSGETHPYPEAAYTYSDSEKSAQSQAELLPVALLSSAALLAGGVLAWVLRKKK